MAMRFKPGDLIVDCQPFVYILDPKQKNRRCDRCFRSQKSLSKCSDCQSMFYCDKKCQKSDWRFHKHECRLFQRLPENGLRLACDWFMLRLLLWIQHSETVATDKHLLFNGATRCFNELETHAAEISGDQQRMTYFQELCRRISSVGLVFEEEQLFELFCRTCINSFSILNEDLNVIGSGLFIEASVFDHSCVPNAAPVFNGTRLQIRALTNIGESQQVLINYIDLKMDRQARQTELKRQYYFDCECLKCRTNSDTAIDFDAIKSLNEQFDQIIDAGENDSSDSNSQWQKAYEIGHQTISPYKSIYGRYHPDLTIQLMRLLKLSFLIEHQLNRDDIISLGRKVDECIRITHGTSHPIYKMFSDFFDASP